MATEEDREAARSLAAVARLAVVRTWGGDPAANSIGARGRSWVLGRMDRLRGAEQAGTGWRDVWSRERPDWRERAAYLGGNEVFGVDYQVCRRRRRRRRCRRCRRCRLGWVEQPNDGNRPGQLGQEAGPVSGREVHQSEHVEGDHEQDGEQAASAHSITVGTSDLCRCFGWL